MTPMRFLSAAPRRAPVMSGLLLALGVVAQGCSNNAPASSASDSKPVLASLTTVVILPTLRATDASARAMRVAVKALEDAPSAATLGAAQTSWRAARRSWSRGEAFRFGPVKEMGIADAIDYRPARPVTIEKVVTGTDPLTASSIELLGSNARGFRGLEYVLFDSVAGDTAVLAKLTTDASAKRRLTYASAVTEHLAGKIAELLAAWEPSGGNFARELTEAGSGAVLFPSAKSAVDQIVNSTAFALDLVTGTKLGRPYGTKSGGVAAPDQEESPLSDNSLADMLDTLDGARNVYAGTYEGAPGRGLAELVRAKNPALDERMSSAFDASKGTIAAIPPPFRTAITTQRPAVETAYQASRMLKNSMSAEVVQVLGTALQYNDNDGD